jgi:ABC-2 type transport system permease protein
MDKVYFIAKKELMTYFKSPIAYITLVLSISVFNVFFFLIIDQNREVSLRDVFHVMEFMFLFLVPIMTMRLFSEEKASGTMEFLMTAPVSNIAIVLGKYIGVLVFFSVLVSLTLIYYAIIEFFGSPDRLTIMSGYVGVWLEGAFFIAVGMMTSSWTHNQIVAAMMSYVILFLLYFMVNFSKYFSGPGETLIQYMSTLTHLEHFIVGVINVGDVVYYLSGIFICIVFTLSSIENRLVR